MQWLSHSARDFVPIYSFVNTGGHFNNSLIKWELVGRKKLYAAQMELKNSCTAVRKKNKAISSFSELYKIPAKL